MNLISNTLVKVNEVNFTRLTGAEKYKGKIFLVQVLIVMVSSLPCLALSIARERERESRENYFASIFGQSWQSRLSCLSSCLDLSFSGNIQQWLSSQQSGVTSQTKYKLSISVYLTVSQLWVVQLARIHCQSTILSWSWWWLGEGGRASVSRTLVKNFPH